MAAVRQTVERIENDINRETEVGNSKQNLTKNSAMSSGKNWKMMERKNGQGEVRIERRWKKRPRKVASSVKKISTHFKRVADLMIQQLQLQ